MRARRQAFTTPVCIPDVASGGQHPCLPTGVPSRLRTRHRTGTVIAATLVQIACALLPAEVRAQQTTSSDTQPALPNVLLLIDTSGSMERMIDNAAVETEAPCVPGQTSAPNRWGRVIQTLTGSVQPGYSCQAVSRASNSPFTNEFQVTVNGQTYAPADADYFLPWHRPISTVVKSGSPSVDPNDICMVGPGTLPGVTSGSGGVGPLPGRASGQAAWFYPTTATVNRRGSALLTDPIDPTLHCFSQLTDGIIDNMTDLIRFGLMTFDQDTNPQTGATFGGYNVANCPLVSSNPFQGTWSYFYDWNTSLANASTGKPFDCTTAAPFFENGGRNQTAPPWEGRFIPFDSLDHAVDSTSIAFTEQNNANIQQTIISTRPFGATPTAGLMTDAQTYFFDDLEGPQQRDPFVQQGCRDEAIILVTDGAPNSDLRPNCANGVDDSNCPYKKPEDTAADLLAGISKRSGGSNAKVKTYVIGFAVTGYQSAQGNLLNCSQMTDTLTQCAPSNPNIASVQACCNLQAIAVAGGTTKAYFADTADDLQAQFQAVINSIQKSVTSRTVPSYSPVLAGSSSGASSSVYLASFVPSVGKAPWSGDIERKRFQCVPGTMSAFEVQPQPVSRQLGDDFAYNINNNPPTSRNFIAERITTPAVDAAAGLKNVRPFALTATDFTTLNSSYGSTEVGITPSDITASSGVDVNQMNIQTGDCPNQTGTETLSAAQCAKRALLYAMGQPSMSMPDSTYTPFVNRSTDAFGDIYRATPAVVAPGVSLLRDTAYQQFRCIATNCSQGGVYNYYAAIRNRLMDPANAALDPNPTIVYAATNDGLLHAFFGDPDKSTVSNELWAMFLPHVLPGLKAAYNSRQQLLDGPPIVKDVVWTRTAADALSPAVGRLDWHTMLVGGYGAGGGGYYAVDVTNPDAAHWTPVTDPTTYQTSPPPGPHFRWQLSNGVTGSDSRTLFASSSTLSTSSGVPTIATVAYRPATSAASDPPQEVGIAILPGGSYSAAYNSPTFSQCARQLSPGGGDIAASAANALDANFPARGAVRQWASNCTHGLSGRAVYVVRVDTGEILRAFGRFADGDPVHSDIPDFVNPNVITNTPLDSPMSGTPLVYPSEVGAIAQKFFVGDSDGTIWRFDVSSPNPANWVGEIFNDLYSPKAMTAAYDAYTANPPLGANHWAFPANWQAGQDVGLPAVLSLNTKSNLILNVASGTQDDLLSTGVFFLYSIQEMLDAPTSGTAKLRASVDWYQPLISEHISGPMAVFNSTLFYSTYVAPVSSAACTSGDARLYARDFVNPYLGASGTSVTDPRAGGNDRSIAGIPFPYQDEGPNIIPGVSVNVTPTCNSSTQTTTDPLTGQTHFVATNITEGTYSLYAQQGAKDPTGAQTIKTVQISLPTPQAATIVDSWASIVE